MSETREILLARSAELEAMAKINDHYAAKIAETYIRSGGRSSTANQAVHEMCAARKRIQAAELRQRAETL